MYQKVLYDYLAILPSYLGGCCTCMKCSKICMTNLQQPCATGTSNRLVWEADINDDEDSLQHPSREFDGHPHGNFDHLIRTAIIGVLIFWVLIAFSAGIYDSGILRFSSWCETDNLIFCALVNNSLGNPYCTSVVFSFFCSPFWNMWHYPTPLQH